MTQPVLIPYPAVRSLLPLFVEQRENATVPNYGTYCPVAVACEAVSDRWTLLVLRELVLGNSRFNDIARGLPGISRTLLVHRLKHLERKGIVEVWPLPGRGHEYRLTEAGKDLEPVLMALGRWAVDWMYDQLDPNDVTPEHLMWWMHRRVDASQLPAHRVVVLFDHTAPEKRRIWLVAERGEVSVCLVDPGFEVDGAVRCATPVLARVFSGERSWNEAVRSGDIEVTGSRTVTGALPRWFVWSPWADVVSAREAGR